MKEIYLSEEQLNNLEKEGQKLFCDENDPTSPTYKRVLVRPSINYIGIILHIMIAFSTSIAYILILQKVGQLNNYSMILGLICLIAYVAICFKKAILCFIRIYQRFAPDALRKKCRFEPSCSQYMMMAIEKYGVIKGVYMGIKRLNRCNIHHGGYDFP